MRKILVLALMAAMLMTSMITAAPVKIEAELNILTPVAIFVSDAALKGFVAWAKVKYGVDVKVSNTSKGTQVAAGMIREWGANPQADIIWGGETVIYDGLAADGFLIKHDVPQAYLDKIPVSMGTPKPLPLKDPKGYWTGTALEPYGLVYNEGLLVGRLKLPAPKTWDDILSDPKYKGQIAQCTPDNSSSSHATYEVILQRLGEAKGWEWLSKMGAYTGHILVKNCLSAPYLSSLSRMRYFGPVPNGVASRNCWATQASLGARVTPTCTTRRDPSSTMKKANIGRNSRS